MYRAIRGLHLCAGAFALVFLAMYSISALQMTHGKWVHMEARAATRDVALPPGLSGARAAARELAARYGIEGELAAIRVLPAGLAFRVLRPGMVWEADYTASTGATRLRITDTGTLGALNRIHQMRGVWHTWIAYDLWAWLLAFLGAAILALGATGLYLWWQSHRDRRFTGALLIFALAAIGGLAAWMRW
ncbi:MAG: PepSY domain-containing protein [Acidobacteria bacterium]|nr:PepSY domain-containing protein [Acidobacteriota bacterium]